MLTLLVGEHAISFREQLKIGQVHSGTGMINRYESFMIVHENVNYLAKMNTDTAFLGNTKYTKYFNISIKSDPFLLAAATPYQATKGQSKRKQFDLLKSHNDLIELPIPIPILKRIKIVDLVLLKEQKLMKMTPMSENKKQAHDDILNDKLNSDKLDSEDNSKMFKTETDKFKVNKINDEVKNLDNDELNKNSEKSIEEINKTDNEECDKSLNLIPLDINDKDAEELLELYKGKISEKFVKTYCPIEKLIEKSDSGYNPVWLCYKSGKSSIKEIDDTSMDLLSGLAVFYIDPASQTKPRVSILHASVTKEEILTEFLEKLIEYIWKNINCDEIRVELSYFKEEAKLDHTNY